MTPTRPSRPQILRKLLLGLIPVAMWMLVLAYLGPIQTTRAGVVALITEVVAFTAAIYIIWPRRESQ